MTSIVQIILAFVAGLIVAKLMAPDITLETLIKDMEFGHPAYELYAAGCLLESPIDNPNFKIDMTRVVRLPEVWDCTGTSYSRQHILIDGVVHNVVIGE